MKAVTRIFLKGLAAVLPITVTLYVLYWLGSTAESLFRTPSCSGGIKWMQLKQR